MQLAVKYGLIALKLLLSAFFAYAAYGKFTGAEISVLAFDAIGWGDWFRYLAGVMQLGGAIFLWVPGVQALGALLIGATMVGAVIFHLLILGPSAVPAAVLAVMSGLVLYAYREQVLRNA